MDGPAVSVLPRYRFMLTLPFHSPWVARPCRMFKIVRSAWLEHVQAWRLLSSRGAKGRSGHVFCGWGILGNRIRQAVSVPDGNERAASGRRPKP